MSWSSPKYITAPSAKYKSDHSSVVVPNAAPSEASGTTAVVAVIVVACNVLLFQYQKLNQEPHQQIDGYTYQSPQTVTA